METTLTVRRSGGRGEPVQVQSHSSKTQVTSTFIPDGLGPGAALGDGGSQ